MEDDDAWAAHQAVKAAKALCTRPNRCMAWHVVTGTSICGNVMQAMENARAFAGVTDETYVSFPLTLFLFLKIKREVIFLSGSLSRDR